MASNLIVKKITYEDTKPFILNIHYARRMPCIQYAFGLFEWDEFFETDRLIGICTFGQPPSPSLCRGIGGEQYRKRVLELNRLCLLPNKNKPNYASKLVGNALRQLPKGFYIVSYADTAWGHCGAIYQACNFIYTGLSAKRTDVYSPSGHARHATGNPNIRQTRSAKHRYIFITGKGGIKNQMLRDLKYPIKPYPKGDTVRYDTENPQVLVKTVVYEKEVS